MTTTNQMQTFTAVTSAVTDVADFQRIHVPVGNPSDANPKQVQGIRFFASGTLSGTGATPTNATGVIVLRHNGLRLWQTTFTLSTKTAQTADAYAVADAEDDVAVLGVELDEDTRGILDLIGAHIDAVGDMVGETGDTNGASWWIGIDNMGGYKSITMYGVPIRRV